MLYLLFAVGAFAACETGTCTVCKNDTTCDWYGFDCLSKTSTSVTTLNISPKPCDVCQAGNCTDCQAQFNCSWYSSSVPGLPGKCLGMNSTSTTYTVLDTCPTCQLNTDCASCLNSTNTACGWYELPGRLSGKCREAPPSFAYSKVADCAGNPCADVPTCKTCQQVNNTAGNASACLWFSSKSPSFYNSKCDDNTPGLVNNGLYDTISAATTCPVCAGTSCPLCQAEDGCQWVAASILGTGTAFGQCITTAATIPTGKKVLTTCPGACALHTCVGCSATASCSWFSGSPISDDSCDLTSDAKVQHPLQTPTVTANCPKCAADQCYDCNNLNGCGWYADIHASVIFKQGCYPTNAFPSGRTLLANTNSKCKGAPSSSSHVAVSAGVLAVLAFLA